MLISLKSFSSVVTVLGLLEFCGLPVLLSAEPPLAQKEDESCGPPLEYSDLVRIAKEAILVTGGDPSQLEEDYRISVRPQGCDYLVVGIRQPETIAQEFSIVIARSGEVKSWPWCCVPEFKIAPLNTGAPQELGDAGTSNEPSPLPLDVQLEHNGFLYEQPSRSSGSVALLKPRARVRILEHSAEADLGSIWWLVETEDVRPKRKVRGYLELFFPGDLRKPSAEVLQTLEDLTKQAREQQLAAYVDEHRQRYWQAKERVVSLDDGPPVAGVPRDRCDGVSPEESSLYDDAPVIEVRQVLRPRSTFTEDASVECRQSGSFDDGRQIRDYQVEFGSKGGLHYRIYYSDASGSIYEPTEDSVSDTLWSLQCEVDSMDDSRRCHLSRGALSVVFLGEQGWLVFVGGADNYPDSEIAIRFGEEEPLRAQEPSFASETALRIVEALEAEGRVRLRYQKWPSGFGDEDFEARGFRLAKNLMLWTFEALAP